LLRLAGFGLDLGHGLQLHADMIAATWSGRLRLAVSAANLVVPAGVRVSSQATAWDVAGMLGGDLQLTLLEPQAGLSIRNLTDAAGRAWNLDARELDVGRLLDEAAQMADACRTEDAAANPGVALGVVIGEAAKAGRDKLTIVASQTAHWETEEANAVFSNILTANPDIKGVMVANDSMALGVSKALDAAGKSGQIKVVGFDNIPAIRPLIKQGKVLATVDQFGTEMAANAIDYGIKSRKDKQPLKGWVKTPIELVTAKNVK
jgi:hypothetical protein